MPEGSGQVLREVPVGKGMALEGTRGERENPGPSLPRGREGPEQRGGGQGQEIGSPRCSPTSLKWASCVAVSPKPCW